MKPFEPLSLMAGASAFLTNLTQANAGLVKAQLSAAQKVRGIASAAASKAASTTAPAALFQASLTATAELQALAFANAREQLGTSAELVRKQYAALVDASAVPRSMLHAAGLESVIEANSRVALEVLAATENAVKVAMTPAQRLADGLSA